MRRGRDELADVYDHLLLQHGLADVVREALAVQHVLDLVRRQRLINHLLLVAEHAQRHLVANGGITNKNYEYDQHNLVANRGITNENYKYPRVTWWQTWELNTNVTIWPVPPGGKLGNYR